MAKKLRSKKKLKIYFLVILIGVFSFAATRMLLDFTNRPPVCANSKTCNSDLSFRIDNNVAGIFEGRKVNPPVIDASSEETGVVLGAAVSPGEKHIYIDLATQTLIAYQGKTQVLKAFVSTGKWGRTPAGNFNVWQKLLSTRMAGGQGADYYDLPNVQYVMYFYHDFGLHTAYWHNNFGHTMSHGCVNMRKVDAKALYDWADGPSGKKLGTAVSVCDEITKDNKCIQNNPVQL